MSEEYVEIVANRIEDDGFGTLYLYFDWNFSEGRSEFTTFILNDVDNNRKSTIILYQDLTILPNWIFYNQNENYIQGFYLEPQSGYGTVYIKREYEDVIKVNNEFLIAHGYEVRYNSIVYTVTKPGYLSQTTFEKDSNTLTLNDDVDILDYAETDPDTGMKTIYGYFYEDDYRDFDTTYTLSIPDLKIPEGEELEIMEARVVLTGNPDIRGTLRCRELIIEG